MMGFRQLLKYPSQKMTLKKVAGGRRLLFNEPKHTHTDKTLVRDFSPSKETASEENKRKHRF